MVFFPKFVFIFFYINIGQNGLRCDAMRCDGRWAMDVESVATAATAATAGVASSAVVSSSRSATRAAIAVSLLASERPDLRDLGVADAPRVAPFATDRELVELIRTARAAGAGAALEAEAQSRLDAEAVPAALAEDPEWLRTERSHVEELRSLLAGSA